MEVVTLLEKTLDPRLARSRLALLTAMTELVDERDIAKISITDVVGRAGVTRPTFYQHFSDIAALGRRAFLTRLESAFPILPQDDVASPVNYAGMTEAEALDDTVEVSRTILIHLMEHSAFYRRILEAAGTVELFDDLVVFLEDRLIVASPLGPLLQSSRSISPADRGTILAGGVVWLVIRWLQSDFEGQNTPDQMAVRIAHSLMVLARDRLERAPMHLM